MRIGFVSARAEDALAKMRLGMYAMFREGSAWHDLAVVAKSITEGKADSRFACLPELRLTDRGLVDCRTFTFVDPIIE